MSAPWTVVLLTRTHERDAFACGQRELDEFLRQYARQNQEENVGRTWVAVREGERRVLGFYTLTVASVGHDSFPPAETKRLPRYPVPVAHLGRLAVDRSVRGMGLGEHLLLHALRQILRVSEVVGVYAVEVRAKDDEARRFYEHYGFKSATDDARHLYLPLKTVRKLKLDEP